ncbi:MAG: FdhF/YdeP family oxidoreductase [Candidatus Binatia bacterium]
MGRSRVRYAGGLAALAYTLRKGREAGGLFRLYGRLRSRNACKTCALGMGGQLGGMVDEAGHFPEVCKKSAQAQAADMSAAIGEGRFRDSSLMDMATLDSASLEAMGRLVFPIVADQGDTHYRRISWDEALERMGQAFAGVKPDEAFFYSSGRSSNEAAFLMQLVARAWGTNNINNCSYYCHQASGVGLSMVYGSGTASVNLDDVDRTDIALVAGANPASNHPRLISKLVKLRRRGGRVIVVNPLRELGLERFRVPSDWRSMAFGSRVSDLYLQPHIGGDVALFKALLKGVVEAGGLDESFVANHCSGWGAVRADLDGTSMCDLVEASGLRGDEVECAVRMLVGARSGVFMWAMGLTHHTNGVDNVLALCNLALARGWLGRRGAGLLPLRGHSNVQGVGSCGVSPGLKQAFARRLEEAYGFALPSSEGLDTFASMEAAAAGLIKAAFLLGGNLFASNPDSGWASAALGRIPFVVYLSTKLNRGHLHGRGKTTLVLPVLARDEEFQATTQESMFNFVRISDGGSASVAGEMRSEVDVLSSFAERLLAGEGFNWSAMRSHQELRRAMADAVPGYAAIAEVDANRREFQIDGRTLHRPEFSTPGGKAAFHVTPHQRICDGSGRFRLMTLRSEGQFNTVVYEDEDLYRGNRRRDVVMVSAEDARALSLDEGDRVVVESATGSLAVSVALVDIRPGNLAMYFPEANVLVPRRLDPRSRTPAFKSVSVTLRPLGRRTENGQSASRG